MRNKVYFVGGAKGVGKTSLLSSKLIKETKLEVVNTGDFFNEANRIYTFNVKEIAKKNMLNYLMNGNSLIADTHYAGFLGDIYSGEFERGLYEEELSSLNYYCDLKLILITLDPMIVLKRRTNDSKNRRDLVSKNIKKEIEANRSYFEQYCSQLQKKGTIIKNLNYNLALKALEEVLF